jgi:hypothetical protein
MMPRPKLLDEHKKSKLFTAKMLEEDYISFQAAASTRGTDMSKFFYQWAIEQIEETKAKYPDRFEKFLEQYRNMNKVSKSEGSTASPTSTLRRSKRKK